MADTIEARVTLRASQGLSVELTLGGTPANPVFQPNAYQNDAYQVGGLGISRTLAWLTKVRPS